MSKRELFLTIEIAVMTVAALFLVGGLIVFLAGDSLRGLDAVLFATFVLGAMSCFLLGYHYKSHAHRPGDHRWSTRYRTVFGGLLIFIGLMIALAGIAFAILYAFAFFVTP